MAWLREAMGVLESCAIHSHSAGGAGHAFGKFDFRACDGFANSRCGVISGFD